MARIPGPMDVPYAPLSVTRRVTPVQADQSGERASAVGHATQEILNRARDQQIETQVADAELRTRKQLDQLRSDIENAPADKLSPQDYETSWAEQANAIVEGNAAALSSPMHQRLWRARTDQMLVSERQGIAQLSQRRTVENARAGLISSIGEAQTTLVDENATPQARATALQVIEGSVNQAVRRRTIGADDGAQMIESARRNALEFERTQGLRAQAQQEEDRIWAASGGDLTSAMEMARDIEQPTVRDSVVDRIATRFNQQQAAERDSLDASMGRAYALIERTGSFDGLAPADRALITQRGQMDTLRSYIRSRAGVTGESRAALTFESNNRANSLLSLGEDRETADHFAHMDLNAPLNETQASVLGLQAGQTVRQQLLPDDYSRLRQRQRELNGEVAPGEEAAAINSAYSALRNYAEPIAAAQGVAISGRQRDAETTRRFRGFLLREVTDLVTSGHRTPTTQDMQRITNLALAESRSGGFMGMGVESRRVFQAHPYAEVRVRYGMIPQYQRERLARAYMQSRGALPTNNAEAQRIIEDMYQAELTGSAE